ncbi:hypothetical protein VCRA2118O236_160109 [Vibrio crassostreae]|nr:hypothetical protein VCRA2118O236_160109 [Vibrio crassostreae]CAK2602206.1 hypothetical protein VCRA2110O183_180103 [Vibrio crassostreae]CAK2678352.1 hypothetical protein VCRA2121O264_180107 [Vibrio crassostreae]CAK3335113.1 hypothetical protein VCRA2121O262_190003 [Vibrio crassostreae]
MATNDKASKQNIHLLKMKKSKNSGYGQKVQVAMMLAVY